MLTSVRYNRIKAAAEAAGHRMHMTALRGIYHKLEQAIKSIWLKNAFFEEFGLRYIGPIDGHDFSALENALLSARNDKRSVLVHVATQKGRGYQPAEQTPSAWHGVNAFVCETGEQVKGGVKGYSQAGRGHPLPCHDYSSHVFSDGACSLCRKIPEALL
jgi:1-deoxy-D-xylulose-5-phosphate synthase